MSIDQVPATQSGSWHWRLLFDIFVIHNQEDGHEEEQNNAQHNELVGSDAPRHASEDSSRPGDVVISTMQRVTISHARDTLPVNVLKETHPQLL